MPKRRNLNDLIGGIFFLFLGLLGLAFELRVLGLSLFSADFALWLLLPAIFLVSGTALLVDYFSGSKSEKEEEEEEEEVSL